MQAVIAALLLLAALLAPSADAATALGQTAKIAFFSDPHVCQGNWAGAPAPNGGVNENYDQWEFIVDWACDQGAQAIVVTGDLTESAADVYSSGCTDRFKSWFESVIAGRAHLWPVTGNHDTELAIGGIQDEVAPRTDNPYWPLTDKFPDLFKGKTYYSRDLGPVRFHALANCADSTTWNSTAWSQTYANCNPPFLGFTYWQGQGYSSGNPAYDNGDFTGITDASSPQRRWLSRSLADTRPVWDIVGMHRGVWSPFSEPGRPSIGSARYNLMAELSEAGADLVFQGDQHIVAWMKRLRSYPAGSEATEVSPPDSLGPYVISLHGAYVRRDVDTSQVPAGSLIFSKGGEDSLSTRWVYGMFGEFTMNRARLQLVRTAQGPGPTYPLRIVKVAERTILANGARQ